MENKQSRYEKCELVVVPGDYNNSTEGEESSECDKLNPQEQIIYEENKEAAGKAETVVTVHSDNTSVASYSEIISDTSDFGGRGDGVGGYGVGKAKK